MGSREREKVAVWDVRVSVQENESGGSEAQDRERGIQRGRVSVYAGVCDRAGVIEPGESKVASERERGRERCQSQ